jgi:hypothetical protein
MDEDGWHSLEEDDIDELTKQEPCIVLQGEVLRKMSSVQHAAEE